MNINLYHDSHKSIFRSLFGAVPTGARLTLRLSVVGAAEEEVYLRLWPVDNGDKVLPMTKVPGTDFYEARFTVSENSGLLWYFFFVKGKDETIYYGNNQAERGGEGQQYDHEPPSYQITIYDKDSVTPDWFKHAVVYQIFPDRFYHSEKGKSTLEGKRNAVLHSCWNDKPYYCKDPQGGIVQYDFFGGNLAGIEEKLSYLQDLGINTIYLNPVFASASNHRYDTGDYKHIDSFLGTNEEFGELCNKAKTMGIRIILDGVFSHTGDDSLYFNRYGTYPTLGAYQSKASPYYSWYKFNRYPDDYESWWGVGTLPEVTETTPSYMDYIFKAPDSVMKHWLELGISGWRLDVADELPPKFLESFWQELKAQNKDNILIGEVWEDASNKVSYDEQRAYFSGGKLDSVMNYVMRNIMLDFMLGKDDGAETLSRILQQKENYPPENFYACLNLVGSHDVERVLTVLQGAKYVKAPVRPKLDYPVWMETADSTVEFQENENFKTGRLLAAKNKIAAGKNRTSVGQDRLCTLLTWQMTMPGAPCVYYGDEAGVEGYKDPDNRRTFPWGQENYIIQSWCRQMIHIRRDNDALSTGRFVPLYGQGSVLVYARCIEGGRDVFGKPAKDGMFVIAINSSTTATKTITIDTEGLCVGTFRDMIHKGPGMHVPDGKLTFSLPPLGAMLLQRVEPTGTKRAGVLLHPTSLPVKKGEDITEPAFKLLDFLHKAGQSLWQILPLNPPGLGDSPYQSVSAFAGNAGLFVTKGTGSFVTSGISKQEFWEKNKYWLDDYALYMALKNHFQGKPWYEWPDDIKKRQKATIAKYRDVLRAEIEKIDDEQFIFFTKWGKIKDYAHKLGIHIMGDVPIFVSHDSADCWAHQDYFLLNQEGMPELVSGVPPDYFSADGQLWGNPLYNWRAMAQDNYEWWQERFSVVASLVDEVRIDHFRGFAACWGVEYGAKTAREGQWYKGPGESLFEFVQRAMPELTLVAEDLGVITEDVSKMKNDLGFPGMRLLHFGIKERRGGSVAFDTESNCYAYTGTHDNNTTVGWYTEDISDLEQQEVRKMLGLKDAELAEALNGYVQKRTAGTVTEQGQTRNNVNESEHNQNGDATNLAESEHNQNGDVTSLTESEHNQNGDATNLAESEHNQNGDVTSLTESEPNQNGNSTNLTGNLESNAKLTAEIIDKLLVEYVYSRQARTVVIPMQDILALPSQCRMNTPGVAAGNWTWKLTAEQLDTAPVAWLQSLCAKYKR